MCPMHIIYVCSLQKPNHTCSYYYPGKLKPGWSYCKAQRIDVRKQNQHGGQSSKRPYLPNENMLVSDPWHDPPPDAVRCLGRCCDSGGGSLGGEDRRT